MHARSRWGLVVVGVVVVAAIAAVIVYSHGTGSLLGSNATGSPASHAKPLPLSAVVKLPKANVSNGTEPLVVTLADKPSASTPRPRIKAISAKQPAAAGKWTNSGNTEVFKSASTLQPCESYRLTVPKSTKETGHKGLTRRRMVTLKVACPSTTGLQFALARLGYLPDSFNAASSAHVSHAASRRAAAHLLYDPPKGTFVPDVEGAPPIEPGSFSGTTEGALMVFQEQHHLETGEPGPETWAKLLAAVAHKYRDLEPYTFVTVSESLPETLEVHKGSSVVLSSPANTGVPGAETEQGIFPIFERLTSTTMVGEDPDGTKYDVSDVPWVNYFNGGDAVHGYERASYGFPQSNGCVELPISTAERVYPLLAIGDIVWVS